jgi:hypothetical protein
MFWDDASREPADVPAAGSKEIWTVEDFLAGNPVLTASVVIRGDVVRQRPAWIEEIPCGDWPTWIQAACQGRVRFIDRKMSEYRIHVNGSWSSMTNGSRLLGTLQLYQRLREHLAPSYQQQIAQRVAALHWELSRDLEAAGNRERAKTHVVKAVEALLECAPKGESLTEAIPRGLDRIRGKTARDGTFASITGELKALGAPWFRLGECWRNFREYCRLRQEFHDFRRAREGPDMSAVSAGEASVTDDEFCLLRELVVESGAHPGPIVEIGTLLGYTTSRMAVWKAPAKRIITVDNYLWDRWGFTPKTHFELTSLVLFYLTGTGNVQQCRADKNEWFRQYAGEAPSLVFCDAIHTYEETKRDIGWARGAGARLISGHDYSPEFPGVVQAVNEAGGPERLRGTVWCLPASK